VIVLLALLAGLVPADLPERRAYEVCAESYAQVQISGTQSPISIALDVPKACREDRHRLALRLSAAALPNLEQAMQQEDQAVAKRVIAFIRRYR
jgi:hypothetical protein